MLKHSHKVYHSATPEVKGGQVDPEVLASYENTWFIINDVFGLNIAGSCE